MTYLSRISLVVLTTAIFAAPVMALDSTHRAILRNVDLARGGLKGQGIEWRVEVETEEKGPDKKMRLEIQHLDGSVIASVERPLVVRGQKYLVTNTGKMYFHKPSLRNPVAISKRQRLMGNASTGDIAATAFNDNYNATLKGTQSIDGEDCYLYHLKKKSSRASYSAINLWVSKSKRVAVRADFLTSSGKVLRVASYEHNNRLGVSGKSIPFLSKITIVEKLGEKKITEMAFTNYKLVKLDKSMFSLTAFGKD